jgi:hypothetical protein
MDEAYSTGEELNASSSLVGTPEVSILFGRRRRREWIILKCYYTTYIFNYTNVATVTTFELSATSVPLNIERYIFVLSRF